MSDIVHHPRPSRRSILRAALLLGGAASTPALLAACGGGEPSSSGSTGSAGAAAVGSVRYGYVSLTGVYFPIFAALEQGFFDEVGVEMVTSVSRGSAASVQQVLGGALDVVGTAIDTVAVAIDGGAGLVGVSGLLNAPWNLVAVPDVDDIFDLRGKTVGVTQVGSSLEVLLREMMRGNDIGDDEYEVVGLGGTSERVAALQSGAIAAGLMAQPQDFELLMQGFTSVGYANDYLDMQFVANFVSTAWAEQNREALVGMITAQGQGGQWLADEANRDAALEVLISSTKCSPTAAASTYDLYAERDLFGTAALTPNTSGIDALLQAAQTVDGTAADYFDTTYLDDVSI